VSRKPRPPVLLRIEGLSHEGRGIARHPPDPSSGGAAGKVVFVADALPGERVRAQVVSRRRDFDEADTLEVLEASPERVSPRCAHFGVCGGCALQHLDHGAQVRYKQQWLADMLARIGQVSPEQWAEPLTGPIWGYRHRARLGAKWVGKRDAVLVGFRERRSHLLAALQSCPVLHPSVGERLLELGAVLARLSIRERLPQIEVSVDDRHACLTLRHLEPLTEADRAVLKDYAEASGLWLRLQSAGMDSIVPLWPEVQRLSYAHPQFGVEIGFEPGDFTQINFALNRAMVAQAVDWLAPTGTERVLELFAGLGNFTLPLARRVAGVLMVEGEAAMVARAEATARANGLENVEVRVADLTQPLDARTDWLQSAFDLLLLDPPRTGAIEILAELHRRKRLPPRILYVSCNPATLARDAGLLVREAGFRLRRVGLMDLFPHTAHAEAMALFER